MDSSTTATVWDEAPVEPATILTPSPPEQAPDRLHNRHSTLWRVVGTVLTVVAVLLLVAALIAFWAHYRFVIAHVEIADVAAYESVVTPGLFERRDCRPACSILDQDPISTRGHDVVLDSEVYDQNSDPAQTLLDCRRSCGDQFISVDCPIVGPKAVR